MGALLDGLTERGNCSHSNTPSNIWMSSWRHRMSEMAGPTDAGPPPWPEPPSTPNVGYGYDWNGARRRSLRIVRYGFEVPTPNSCRHIPIRCSVFCI